MADAGDRVVLRRRRMLVAVIVAGGVAVAVAAIVALHLVLEHANSSPDPFGSTHAKYKRQYDSCVRMERGTASCLAAVSAACVEDLVFANDGNRISDTTSICYEFDH